MGSIKLIFIFLIISFFSLKGFGQSAEEMLKGLDSVDAPKSGFKIGAGIGNSVFSTDNKAQNARQVQSPLAFTPSIEYVNKSGFSITATGYLTSYNNKTSFSQYAINPAYEYEGKNVSFLLSYARYIIPDSYNTSTSPVQNDFYSNLVSTKGWLNPGIAVGFGNGNFKDSVRIDTLNIHGENISSSKFKNFSLIGTLEHTFKSYGLLSKGDEFNFTPQLSANMGGNKTLVTNSLNISFVRNRGRGRNISKSGKTSDSSPFQLESAGLNLDVIYATRKFSFEPDLYLDYYLPSTTLNRLTEIATFNIFYNF